MSKFNDAFTRANSSDLGSLYDAYGANVLHISGEKVRGGALGGACEEAYNGTTFLTDQFARVRVITFNNAANTGEIAVLFRAAAPTTRTFYAMSAVKTGGTNGSEIYKRVAGTFTSLGTSATDISAGDILMGTCATQRIRGYVNGTSVASNTDSAITGTGQIGLRVREDSNLADVELDNFEGGELPNHRATASGATNSTTSFTITIPASTLAGDILVVTCGNKGATADPSMADNDTGGNLWQKIISGNNGSQNLSTWWKRATSGTASKTITGSGFTTGSPAVLSVYAGISTDKVPYANQTYETNASANETHAGFTPTENFHMVCLSNGNFTNDLAVTLESTTDPGTLVHRAELLNTSGTDSSVTHSSELQVLAAPTGNFTWSQTDAASTSITFSLKPDMPSDNPARPNITSYALERAGFH